MAKSLSKLLGFPLYIDSEFATVLPERKNKALLKALLLKHGFRDPFVYWANPPDNLPTLLDGHERYRIWLTSPEFDGVEPNAAGMEFDSREDAIQWMKDNQDARRNWLSAAERDEVLAAALAKAQEESPTPAERAGKHGEKAERHNDAQLPEGKAADRVADEFNVSPRTVERAAEVVKASAAIRNADPKLADQIESGEVKLSKTDLAILGKMKPPEIREAAKQIRLGKPWKPEKPKAAANGKPRSSKPKEISPAKMVDELKRKYLSPLVKGLDAVAKVNGGQGPFYKAADAALDKFAVALKSLREGRQ